MTTAVSISIPREPSLATTVVRTPAELEGLGASWKGLFARIACDNVFLSFEWLSAWWKHIGRGTLFVVVVHDEEGRLLGLAPLYISVVGPLRLRRLGFLGDTLVGSDYLDFLVEEAHAEVALRCIGECIQENRRAWDYLELDDTRSDSLVATSFRQALEAAGMTAVAAPATTCPFATLPESMEAYLGGIGTKLRKNFGYYSRALRRESEVAFVAVSDPGEIGSAFTHLLRLHGLRFDSRGDASAFLDPKVMQFHREAVQALAQAGWARVFLLRLASKPIAALYGFTTGGRMMYYQSGLDPEYSRLSVGMVMLGSVIEAAIASNHREFDFLRGNHAYKSQWANGCRELMSLRFFDQRPKSRLAKARHDARVSLKGLKAGLLAAAENFKTRRSRGERK